MADRDLYEILGVKRDASAKEIRAAYRELARKYHPDRNPDDAQAEERFKEASYASDVLLNEEKRKLYDEFGEIGLREGFDADAYRQYASRGAGGGGGVHFDFGGLEDLFGRSQGTGGFGGGVGVDEDLLEALFGRRGARPSPRREVRSEVTIDFTEAVRGVEKELSLQLPGDASPRMLKVRIPEGVTDGGKIRLRGQGVEGGDLVLVVHVRPHAHFKREGHDLLLELPITVGEAYAGAKVTVPTPHGAVSLRVPQGSESGRRLRLRGKGVRRGGTVGDLIVSLRIVLPKASEEVRKAIETLDRAYEEDPRGDLSW